LKKKQILENEELAEEKNEYRIAKENKIKVIEKKQENERELLRMKLMEKDQKLYEFKQKKIELAEKKKLMQSEMDRKKQEYTQEMEKIFYKSTNIDNKTFKKLKKMFPDNKKIDELIEKMNNPNKSQSRFKINKSKVLSNSHRGKIRNNRSFILSKNKSQEENSKNEENKKNENIEYLEPEETYEKNNPKLGGIEENNNKNLNEKNNNEDNNENNNNENNMNENFGMSAKNADFNKNLEEEYPRTLAQPQSQIIRK
jgi:hypothetical protein